MVISFQNTTPALLAGAKTVTRREWKERTADYFTRWLCMPEEMRKGTKVERGVAADAYDKSPRNGGRKVADILVTSCKRELLSDMPDSDYEAEGFAWLASNTAAGAGDPWHVISTHPLGYTWPTFSRPWFEDARRMVGVSLYVIRFELVRVV